MSVTVISLTVFAERKDPVVPSLFDWGSDPAPQQPAAEPVVTATLVARKDTGPRTRRFTAGRKQGEHGTGSLTYTPADVEAVRRVLDGKIVQDPVTVAQIAERANLNGRTVRAILSERDGIDFLVGCAPSGALWDASRDPVGGGSFTLKLQSQVRRMAERIRRRNAYVEGRGLPPVAE